MYGIHTEENVVLALVVVAVWGRGVDFVYVCFFAGGVCDLLNIMNFGRTRNQSSVDPMCVLR